MKNKPVILIVDDHPQNIELLEAYLAPQGYEIVTAASGEEALGKLPGNQIDLILLDIVMPGMNGFEVTRRIRQDNTHRLLPIILITVLREAEDRIKGIEAGCDDFITMPDDKIELLPRIRSLLKVKDYNDLMSNYQKEMESEVTKRTEELKHTLIFQQRLIDALPVPVFYKDTEGRYLGCNSAFEKYFGQKREQFAGKSVYDINSKEIADIYHEKDMALLQNPGIKIYESTLKDAGGVVHNVIFHKATFLNSDDSVGGLIGAILDVTERKQAEEALRKSEERFRAMFDMASIGMAQAHPLTGGFHRVNQKMCDITGYSSDELLSLRVPEITHPEDRELDWEAFQRVVSGQSPNYRREKRYIRKDGSIVWVNVNMTVIRDSNGQSVATMATIEDISERKQAEVEKTKLQEQFLQAQKMESVGRLAGGVAHDFNNMLGVILGHTEMAMEQVDPAQTIYANLQEIHKAANRSADLTRQLLAFARKQTVSPKVLDVNETVEGMLKMLRRLIGEDIQLAWLPGINLWQVKIDPSQLDQILANLCVNARDAIASVGKVIIETGNIIFDEAYVIDHMGSVPGEYALLSVSDDGCGMSKEILDKLFEPFFTTKVLGKGTGLGLATVYGIVKQNNGFINVYSEPDQGTTFRIYLPRYIGKAEQIEKEGRHVPVIGGQETLLVVEDEPAILSLCKLMLEKQGYHVLTAGTPGEAIRLAEEHVGKIHLLISDVVMPEMNGRDLAKKMLSFYPDLKRLFMSGYTANVIAHQGVLDEGVPFIQKPFSGKDLAAKVRAVLDQK